MQTFQIAPEAKERSGGSTNGGQNTIGEEIQRLAELQPDHAAVVASGFAPLSYQEFQNLIDEVRTALRLAGFGRSARIAIAMRSGPQAALAIVAVACSAVSIPLNPRQTLNEIETCLAALRPDAVLVAKGADSAARRVAARKGVTIIEAIQSKDGSLDFSISASEISIAVASGESDEPDADAPAFILQTSGTSAEPKLIPTSHGNMLAAAARVRAWFDLTPNDCCLSVSPVFYAHGLHVTVFAPLLSGGTIAFPTDASKFDHSEWFGALKPTWYSAGPTLHRLVFDRIKTKADEKTGHALRFVLSGGAPLPRDVLEGLQQMLGIPVVEHYGSSEGMQICSNLLPPGPRKLGTVGLPWPDTIRIVGDDGSRVPAGVWGEILVGGPTVVSGYLEAPELNRVAFIDGWFISGDIGNVDEEGFLTLHGRKDDLINRGGEKVSPVEIDDALMRHPAVAEAAAFAVPHPRLGEDVAAAVILRPGMTATPIELRGYLQEQLATFKVPRRIIIRDQLPKGQTGKVVRRQLAALLELEQDGVAGTGTSPQAIDDKPVDSALILKLTEIWERLLKSAPLSPDDDFFESGGNSLLAVEMLSELELWTGRTVPNTILFETPTIRQLARKLSEANPLTPEPLIRLNSNGSQTPLFFFHGDFHGSGYYVTTLSRLLGSELPLFIIAPHGVGDEPIPDTIEAMAAERLPLIMDAQPEGPYRLFGNCLGGVVAFEVARLLIAAGKRVELVVMMDPPTVSASRAVQVLLATMRHARPIAGTVVDRIITWTFLKCAELQKFCNISWTRRWSAMRTRVRNVTAGSHQEPVAPGVALESGAEEEPFQQSVGGQRRRAEREIRYACAMSNYVPAPLAVQVVYFAIDYSGRPWRRISSDLEVVKLSGSHYHYDFADIAKHLRAWL